MATTYTLTSRDPEATATEGWSGVQDRELSSLPAAVAWFGAEVIDAPYAQHTLQSPDGAVLLRYDPQ